MGYMDYCVNIPQDKSSVPSFWTAWMLLKAILPWMVWGGALLYAADND